MTSERFYSFLTPLHSLLEVRGFSLSSLLFTHSSIHSMYYRNTILWQKAMEAARETYRLTPRLPGTENLRHAFADNARGCVDAGQYR